MATTMTSPSSTLPSLSWDTVLVALRGNKYTQGTGGMCYAEIDSNKPVQFCVLGVINHMAGADWEVLGDDNYACDQHGETQVPSLDLLESLGLTKVTDAMVELSPIYRDALVFHMGSNQMQRWEVLSFLNDCVGFTLSEIADEIERLGWNVEG